MIDVSSLKISSTTFIRQKISVIFTVCSKGYYYESATTCTECPDNQYKDVQSDATTCTACPSGSETTATGRTSSSDCRTYD